MLPRLALPRRRKLIQSSGSASRKINAGWLASCLRSSAWFAGIYNAISTPFTTLAAFSGITHEGRNQERLRG